MAPRRRAHHPRRGATAVAQPVDTDLNQHVKRKYMAAETDALVKQVRDGKKVSQLRRVDCVDLMVEVLSDRGLHISAAEGFFFENRDPIAI